MNKIGRNDMCPCGSGRKFKYCCITKQPKERNIETSMKCTHCGSNVTLDLTYDPMNHLASLETPLKIFCKDNDIYMFGLLTLDKVCELEEGLKSNNLNKTDIISAYIDCATEERCISLLEFSFKESDVFNKRKNILLDAFRSHFEGRYTLSVPALLAQIEGIMRDIGGLKLKDTFKPTIKTDIWDRRLYFSVKDNAEYFNAFISNLFKGSQLDDSFNRNPILHGTNIKYNSIEWSLILVLSILEIRSFLWFEQNTKQIIP